ncbi:hypothetical protein BD413DRAFT_528104 [Trametes elegans]|nr:hypothetical protein BD413DRAFT_528104 [Trametes elegans]
MLGQSRYRSWFTHSLGLALHHSAELCRHLYLPRLPRTVGAHDVFFRVLTEMPDPSCWTTPRILPWTPPPSLLLSQAQGNAAPHASPVLAQDLVRLELLSQCSRSYPSIRPACSPQPLPRIYMLFALHLLFDRCTSDDYISHPLHHSTCCGSFFSI